MNKYRNLPIYGFRSKKERLHAIWLDSEKLAGRINDWRYEKSYDLLANGKLIGKHKPDFTVFFPNGVIEVHEIKGGRATMTEAWRLRKKIFECCYPHIAYRVF